MTSVEPITVRPYEPRRRDEWQAFLAVSNNGTLFHDLDFLAYHPPGRFDTHHLTFEEAGQLVALLPAAIVAEPDGKRILKSPYGASVGGFVVPERTSAATMLGLVRQLQRYVSDLGLDGIDMRVGPPVYLRHPNDLVGFALMAGGFRLIGRWLLHVVLLTEPGAGSITERYSRDKRYDIRYGLKKGLRPREIGAEGIDDLYELILQTKTRQHATPTHEKREIEEIVRRVPGRARIFLCAHEDVEVAGALVFMLNDVAAMPMYHAQTDAHAPLRGMTVLVAHILDQMVRERVRVYDLGPSSFDNAELHESLAFFKEGFGARGFCRDHWRWERGY